MDPLACCNTARNRQYFQQWNSMDLRHQFPAPRAGVTGRTTVGQTRTDAWGANRCACKSAGGPPLCNEAATCGRPIESNEPPFSSSNVPPPPNERLCRQYHTLVLDSSAVYMDVRRSFVAERPRLRPARPSVTASRSLVLVPAAVSLTPSVAFTPFLSRFSFPCRVLHRTIVLRPTPGRLLFLLKPTR